MGDQSTAADRKLAVDTQKLGLSAYAKLQASNTPMPSHDNNLSGSHIITDRQVEASYAELPVGNGDNQKLDFYKGFYQGAIPADRRSELVPCTTVDQVRDIYKSCLGARVETTRAEINEYSSKIIDLVLYSARNDNYIASLRELLGVLVELELDHAAAIDERIPFRNVATMVTAFLGMIKTNNIRLYTVLAPHEAAIGAAVAASIGGGVNTAMVTAKAVKFAPAFCTAIADMPEFKNFDSGRQPEVMQAVHPPAMVNAMTSPAPSPKKPKRDNSAIERTLATVEADISSLTGRVFDNPSGNGEVDAMQYLANALLGKLRARKRVPGKGGKKQFKGGKRSNAQSK